MANFENILHESAQRTTKKENAQLHVPHNPMASRRTYWGWIAAPVAAVIGVIVGLSLPLLMGSNATEVQYVYATDTIRLDHPVHDTLYLTQTVEKERVVEKEKVVEKVKYRNHPATTTTLNHSVSNAVTPDILPGDKSSLVEGGGKESSLPTCTSIQCDGINYSMLVSN